MNKMIKWFYYLIGRPDIYAKRLGLKFGKNCQFDFKHLGSEPYLITIGDNFRASQNVYFVTHDGAVSVIRNLYPEYQDIDSFGTIQIGDNVFIGINCTILPGSIIEDNVIVGAGSLIKGKLEKNSVYAGVPAKKIMSVEDYKEKNQMQFIHTKKMSKEEKKIFLIAEYSHLLNQ